ncbi:hypothetical protein Btru_049935 [Bulinus truncatus]|nr:hypothetical protein Btru_049935 [Bulinus truncatus]
MKLTGLQNLTRIFLCLSLPQESMKLMGLQTFSFWFTWFLTSFVFGFPPCIIFTVAFCVLTYENGPILYSDPVVIMAVLTLYSVNIISFCCMMSCFISKGRNAAIVVDTLYFLLMFASPLTFQYLDTRRLAHIGGGLLFQSGIGHFLNMLMDFEKRKVSLTFDHMLSTEVLPHLNVLDALVMLLTNTVLNCLIVWYMDNTILFTRNKLFSIVLVLVPVVLIFIGIEFDIRDTLVKKSKDLLFTLDRFPKDLMFPVFYPEGYKNCSFVR